MTDAERILAQRLADLEARVWKLEQPRRRRRPDPARDSRLLSAIAARLGASVFSATDLRGHARTDPALRAALEGASGRAIGAWLGRLHKQPTGPYRLRHVGREGAGMQWALDVSAALHTQRRLSPVARTD